MVFDCLVRVASLTVCWDTGPQQPPTVVVQSAQPQNYPPDPVLVTCPNCHAAVTTATEPTSGLLMWLVVGGLCIFW